MKRPVFALPSSYTRLPGPGRDENTMDMSEMGLNANPAEDEDLDNLMEGLSEESQLS